MCVAAAFAAVAVGATAYSASQAEDAEDAQYEAAQNQKKAQTEQRAVNYAQSAKERRTQLREERIRRARLTQTATNTGTAESSGYLGASSGLVTQLGANLGENLSMIGSANRISLFSQASADSMSQANALNAQSQMWGQVASLAMSGASLYSAPSPAKTEPTKTE